MISVYPKCCAKTAPESVNRAGGAVRGRLRLRGGPAASRPDTGGAEHFEKAWRIGVLTPTRRPAPDSPHYYNDFVRELRDLGYHEAATRS